MRTAVERPRISGWCAAGQCEPSELTTGCRTPETCQHHCHTPAPDPKESP